jgi:hypothetical protein
MDGSFKVTTDSGEIDMPLGYGKFDGNTRGLKWTAESVMRTGFESGNTFDDGSWMLTSPYLRWNIWGVRYLNTGDYILIANIPPDLPASAIEQLKQNFQSDSTHFLSDLNEIDRESVTNYFGEVMENSFRTVLDGESPVTRRLIHDQNDSYILSTNTPMDAQKILDLALWKEIRKTGNPEVAYALLITHHKIIITSYPVALDIKQINRMATVGIKMVQAIKRKGFISNRP